MSELKKIARTWTHRALVTEKYEECSELLALEVKTLMIETFSKALEAKSIAEMGEIYRKEVEAL